MSTKQYLETKIQTATPEALVGMLYEGAVRFLKVAVSGLDEKDWRKAHTNIVRAQNIVSELNVALDKARGGDIAKNLSQIYDYLNSRLIEANIKKDSKLVNECIGLLSDLSSAWAEVMKNPRGIEKAGVNIAS
ncbi:MAG: flagellar export chaperone FliS [Firmicutes bacterium]|nr:flagellar export chaperone FliS [Bacillota bacterium]